MDIDKIAIRAAIAVTAIYALIYVIAEIVERITMMIIY